MRAAALLLGLLCAAVRLQAQPPLPPPRDIAAPAPVSPAQLATIRGRVVGGDTAVAVRKARVTLTPDGGQPLAPAYTDADGRFVIGMVPPGRYTVSVRKAGYPQTTFGARRPGTRPTFVDVEPGDVVDGIEIHMPSSGAISGHLVDEFGDPIEAAMVTAARIVRIEGRVDTVRVATAVTDDRGEYRLGGLPAGTFVVEGTERMFGEIVRVVGTGVNGRMEVEGTAPRRAYYPGVASLAAAQPIEIRPGEERSTGDFTLVAARQAKLTMSFTDDDGRPVAASGLLSSPADSTGGPGSVWTLPSIGPTISTNVEPGDWRVYARGDQLAGSARVSLASGEDLAITLRLAAAGHLEGRVMSDGGPLPRDAIVEIAAASRDLPSRAAAWLSPVERMKRDGSFVIGQLLGRVQLRVSVVRPSGWVVKAIESEGRSLLDRTIEFRGGERLSGVRVVLTDRCATIAGTVVDARHEMLADYSVLVFPADPALLENPGRVARWIRPKRTGEFVADDLLPGDYLAVAVDDVDESQWLNADYLARFRARATPVTLGDREKKMITLELSPQ